MQEDRQQGRKKKCAGDRTGHSACTFGAETTDSETGLYRIRTVSQQL